MNQREEIAKCIEVLKAGGILLYPADTVWGLGCDATSDSAVAKIFEIKNRDPKKSLIILLHDENRLNRYVKNMPEVAWDLLEFSEKPTTIIYDEGYNLAKGVCADDGSVGVRVVSEGFVHQLLRVYNRPMVSTSANLSGQPTPIQGSKIDPKLTAAVDYQVDLSFENKEKKPPSDIIKIGNSGQVKIIRQ